MILYLFMFFSRFRWLLFTEFSLISLILHVPPLQCCGFLLVHFENGLGYIGFPAPIGTRSYFI